MMTEKVQFLIGHEEILHKNIRLADQKAAILLTLNLAALTVLLGATPNLNGMWPWVFGITCAGLFLVVLGALRVIWPRSDEYKLSDDNLAFPMSIEEYQKSVGCHFQSKDSSEPSPLEQSMEELVVQRAKINRDKYRLLRRLLRLCFAVWALSFAASSVVWAFY